MSREELVQGYLDGQLGRRVFIRRLVATGVSAAAALSYASLLEVDPVAAGELTDFYLTVSDFAFQTPVVLQQGQRVALHNHGPSAHNARDTSGLKLFRTGSLEQWEVAIIDAPPGAGIYPYRCADAGHVPMEGRLRVPLVVSPQQAALGSTFNIRWAAARASAGLVFDVQRRAPGASTFTNWRTGVRGPQTNVRPSRKGTFAFRARVRRPANGQVSGWSTAKKIRVT